MTTKETLPQYDRKRHGSLYDRGSADAYYNRGSSPHWYPLGTGKCMPVTDLTLEEKEEYRNGYQDQCNSGEFKEY